MRVSFCVLKCIYFSSCFSDVNTIPFDIITPQFKKILLASCGRIVRRSWAYITHVAGVPFLGGY